MNAGVEIVQKITPGFKDGSLILRLSQLVVDIVVADRFGETPIFGMADTVTVHCLIGNRILRGVRSAVLFPCGPMWRAFVALVALWGEKGICCRLLTGRLGFFTSFSFEAQRYLPPSSYFLSGVPADDINCRSDMYAPDLFAESSDS